MLQNKKVLIFGAGAIVLVLFFLLRGCAAENFVPVKVGPVTEALYALGNIKAENTYSLRFGMSSVISKLYVDEGDTVTIGTALLMTDNGIVIRSPQKGVITTLNYKEKELVAASQEVLTVTDQQQMYVQISLDQNSVLKVRKGQKAEISFEMIRNKKVTGTVESIYPSGGEFIVRIKPQSLPGEILPEMTCDIAIEIGRNEKAILVPSGAVKGGLITIMRKGKKEMLKVETALGMEDMVEITSGNILPSDRVLVINRPKK